MTEAILIRTLNQALCRQNISRTISTDIRIAMACIIKTTVTTRKATIGLNRSIEKERIYTTSLNKFLSDTKINQNRFVAR